MLLVFRVFIFVVGSVLRGVDFFVVEGFFVMGVSGIVFRRIRSCFVG